jgi:hypothetical protein
LGLLVIFCAQIAYAALPPLTPRTSEESVDGDDTADEVEVGMNPSELIHEAQGNVEDIKRQTTKHRRKRKWNVFSSICTAVARFARMLFASKQTFAVWNFIILIAYVNIFVLGYVLQMWEMSECDIYLWVLLTAVYAFLLLSLGYVSYLLGIALRHGIDRRKDVDTLRTRLLGTCALLAWIFLERIICFALAAYYTTIAGSEGEEHSERTIYRRNALQYAVSELLPVIFVLIFMHRRRRGERQSDVLIIHSFVNNLFGSMGRLGSEGGLGGDSTAAPASSSVDGNSVSIGTSGGLGGSRRFQTFGGTTRNESLAPAVQGWNVTRVVSSGGGGGKQPQQQIQQGSHRINVA